MVSTYIMTCADFIWQDVHAHTGNSVNEPGGANSVTYRAERGGNLLFGITNNSERGAPRVPRLNRHP